jgi:PAS domain S-box-containing protein
MTPTKKAKFTELRRQAEEKLVGQVKQIDGLDQAGLAKVAHELAVNQIELEIQNEELRQARLAAENARDLYVDLYDYAPVGYFTLDEHNRVIQVNLTGCQLLRIDRRKLLNEHFTKFIVSEETDRFFLHRKKALENGTKNVLELKMIKTGGTSFQAELSSIKVGEGSLRIALNDISERKRLELALVKAREELEKQLIDRTNELSQSEAEYHKIVETANEGVWVTNPDGKVLFVNNKITEMLGYSREEILGRTGMDFIAPRHKKIVLSIREKLAKGISLSQELLFLDKNGTEIWFLASASPLNENGEHQRNLYMMTDITERKRAEDELRDIPRRILQAQETERQGIGRELHDEIGQSLTLVTLLLDRINRVPVEKTGEVLAETKQVVVGILGQVRKLSLELQPGKLEHLGLIETLVQYFEDYSLKTGIKVDFKADGVQDVFPYDLSLAIYRICQEALTNIARYASVSEATIRFWTAGSKLFLQIEDKGKGFNVGSIGFKSSGVISMRERAKILGGELGIKSTPGRGTMISLKIPWKAIKD